jgi:hypothetical protein
MATAPQQCSQKNVLEYRCSVIVNQHETSKWGAPAMKQHQIPAGKEDYLAHEGSGCEKPLYYY